MKQARCSTTVALWTMAISAIAAWPALASLAQNAPPAPTTQPADDAEPSSSSSKTLDELLGIDDQAEEDENAADAAERDSQEELQRKLNEAEIADNFALAIEKMVISADLLDTQFDSGLGTQRVQEDIMARLARLIDQAKKMQQMMSSSSSSSSSSSPAQQPNKSQPNPGPKQSKSSPPGSQRNNNPSDSQEGAEPALQEGDINTVLEENQTEWGNLPQRVRDSMMQGRRGKFSSLYQKYTEEYYMRLAEENVP